MWWVVAFLAGCTGSTVDTDTSVPTPDTGQPPTPVDPNVIQDHDPGPRAVTEEVVATGATAFGVTRLNELVIQDEILTLVDPFGDATEIGLYTDELVRVARLPGGELLLESDLGLEVWDGLFRSTPLDAQLDGIVRWVDTEDALWVEDSAGLHRFDGTLSTLVVGGTPVEGQWVVGGLIYGTPAVWAVWDGIVIGITERQTGWEVLDYREVEPFDLGVEGDGSVVVAGMDGLLHIRNPDGVWIRHRLPNTVHAVHADPRGGGSWLRTAEGWYHHDTDNGFSTVDLGGRVPSIDALGRLLVDEEELVRLSVGRPVQVIGLKRNEVLDGARLLRFAPTAPDRVQQLTVDVFGTPTTFTEPPYSVELDTSSAPIGEAMVRVDVTYDDAETGGVEVPFWVGDPSAPTWITDVAPIHAQNCAVCHTGDTETLLDSRERWQEMIEPILENTMSGAMPLGSEPLSPGEIATLEGWRDGGFLP